MDCHLDIESGAGDQGETLSKVDVLATCRICHEDDKPKKMIKPCKCSGSVAFVHFDCIKSWIESSQKIDCCMCMTRHSGLVIERSGPSAMMYFKTKPLPGLDWKILF